MKEELIPSYRESKAIAAASKLLMLSGGKCDKYWLNKLMYYIERESLIQSGQPMFFDKLYSIPLGPVASAVNDGIDSTSYPADNAWSAHIKLEGNSVKLLFEADDSELSIFEEKIIENAYKKFKGWGFTRLKNFFHSLPEHVDTNSRVDLEYKEILSKTGASEHKINDALSELSYLSFVENTLDCAK